MRSRLEPEEEEGEQECELRAAFIFLQPWWRHSLFLHSTPPDYLFYFQTAFSLAEAIVSNALLFYIFLVSRIVMLHCFYLCLVLLLYCFYFVPVYLLHCIYSVRINALLPLILWGGDDCFVPLTVFETCIFIFVHITRLGHWKCDFCSLWHLKTNWDRGSKHVVINIFQKILFYFEDLQQQTLT